MDLDKLHKEFTEGLSAKVSFKVSNFMLDSCKKILEILENLITFIHFQGFGLKPEELKKEVQILVDGKPATLTHGSVVISAITSCTNTSNPSVMLAAGLVARKVGIFLENTFF